MTKEEKRDVLVLPGITIMDREICQGSVLKEKSVEVHGPNLKDCLKTIHTINPSLIKNRRLLRK